MKLNLFLRYFSFAATVFLGAFLLFQVQPMIGKYILPWFGGSSFVWITSLLFFQVALLLGYSYSYGVTKLPIRLQIVLHCCLLLLSGGIIAGLFFHSSTPIMPPFAWKLPDSFSPFVQVLAILCVSIGLPFFVLSTTSTLLQKWFSYVWQGKSPYALYALSNFGSLLGLVSYPFVIEPLLPLRLQGLSWPLFFLLYVVLFSLACWQTFHLVVKQKQSKSVAPSNSISTKHLALWLFLPAVSSMLLLAVSYHMTQAVAPMPFLWIVPLSLYLISFIVCFSDHHGYSRKVYARLLLLILVTVILSLVASFNLLLFLNLVLYALLLFFSFMVCHGELYRLRPAPRDLNLFYLIVALGSALGSAFVALLAPLFFKGLLWELYIGLFCMLMIVLFVMFSYEDAVLLSFLRQFYKNRRSMQVGSTAFVIVLFALVFGINYFQNQQTYTGIWRNFYGTLRLQLSETDGKQVACLLNGKIIHGCQYAAYPQSREPMMYYGTNSGVGLALQSLRASRKHNLRVGIIGLGVGSIATYGEKGDFFRFYELNPEDKAIAEQYFTFLKDSKAETSVVLGDGRFALQKDLQDPSFAPYDLLVLDAFSDDSIPVHLMTKEAFELYLKSVSPDGIIAMHISNTYLDLNPVAKQLVKHFGLEALFLFAAPPNKDYLASEWVLFANKKEQLPAGKMDTVKLKSIDTIRDVWLWTDDYSNLFQIVRFLPYGMRFWKF